MAIMRVTLTREFVISMPILPQEVSETSCRSSFIMPENDVFFPEGLSVWGATEETLVQCTIAGDAVFPSAVPALMFASALSFQEMDELPLRLLPKLRKAVLWREMPGLFRTVKPKETIELYFEGPVTHAVFWGKLRQPG